MIQSQQRIGLALITLLAGCATAYDSYPCGRVDCEYCPPHALPYRTTENKGCPGSCGLGISVHQDRIEVSQGEPPAEKTGAMQGSATPDSVTQPSN